MSTDNNRSVVCPIGKEFLDLSFRQEDRCEHGTVTRIQKLGIKAPRCLDCLGTTLSLLDRACSCFWGCKGGDHTVEYFAGRVESSALAAIRLIHFGFYDEALSLARSIGEIANLLNLFHLRSDDFTKWKSCTKAARLKNFKPVLVRRKLADLESILIVDDDRYGRLCETAVHVTPDTRPQGHNLAGRVTSGGYIQDGGILVSLNELAVAVSYAAIPLPSLLDARQDVHDEFKTACIDLLEAIGSVDLSKMQALIRE